MTILNLMALFKQFNEREIDLSTLIEQIRNEFESGSEDYIHNFLINQIQSNEGSSDKFLAIEVMFEFFPNERKEILNWLMKNEDNPNHLLKVYNILERGNDQDSNSLIILMEETIGMRYLIKYDIVPREAMALELLGREICRLYDSIYVKEWSFYGIQTKEGNVIKLNIEAANGIINSEYLNFLPHLTELNLIDSLLDNFHNLERITHLKISGSVEDCVIKNINEIVGLENLINLRELDLSKNNIKEIKNLDTLINLKRLNFFNNDIMEIKGLEALKNLEYLSFEDNGIQQIQGLDNLVNLKELDLSNNSDIPEIKGLEQLVRLESLSFENDYRINEIKGLDSLVNLRKLNLSKDSYITDSRGFEGVLKSSFFMSASNSQGLQEKTLNDEDTKLIEKYRNYIKEIKGLDNLENLEELNLSGNQITKIKGFENLKRLKKVNLSRNRISKEETESFREEHKDKIEVI